METPTSPARLSLKARPGQPVGFASPGLPRLTTPPATSIRTADAPPAAPASFALPQTPVMPLEQIAPTPEEFRDPGEPFYTSLPDQDILVDWTPDKPLMEVVDEAPASPDLSMLPPPDQGDLVIPSPAPPAPAPMAGTPLPAPMVPQPMPPRWQSPAAAAPAAANMPLGNYARPVNPYYLQNPYPTNPYAMGSYQQNGYQNLNAPSRLSFGQICRRAGVSVVISLGVGSLVGELAIPCLLVATLMSWIHRAAGRIVLLLAAVVVFLLLLGYFQEVFWEIEQVEQIAQVANQLGFFYVLLSAYQSLTARR